MSARDGWIVDHQVDGAATDDELGTGLDPTARERTALDLKRKHVEVPFVPVVAPGSY